MGQRAGKIDVEPCTEKTDVPVAYDKYCQAENLFGAAYPELLDFFAEFPNKGKVLDLGCGQGPDSIPLARLGFEAEKYRR
jgi:2-polyprenyl-3-methyl-5-hydroxy-6-metoxy-1,4-benzoquinol methylase